MEQSRQTRASGGLGSVACAGVATGVRERASDAETLARARTVPWRFFRTRFADKLAGRAVLVLCDEAQSLDADDKLVRGTVLSLHMGDRNRDHPFRIVPVFGGLSDTKDKLRECGLTRPTATNVRVMGGLSRQECERYALGVLAHLDAQASSGERAAWTRWVADNGEGWPKHQRFLMDSVAVEMERADTPRLRDLHTGRIAARVTDERIGYYHDRIGATGHPRFGDVLAALASKASLPGGAELDALGDEAERLLKDRRNPPDPDALVDAAVHAGILQHVSATHLACPIPSMRRWLETGRYQAPEPTRSRCRCRMTEWSPAP